jgi:hypothetical protein
MAKSSTAAIFVLIFIIGVPPLVAFSPFDCSPVYSVYAPSNVPKAPTIANTAI